MNVIQNFLRSHTKYDIHTFDFTREASKMAAKGYYNEYDRLVYSFQYITMNENIEQRLVLLKFPLVQCEQLLIQYDNALFSMYYTIYSHLLIY